MNASLVRDGQKFDEPAVLCLAPMAEGRVSAFFGARSGTLSNHGHSSYHRAATGHEEADYALVAIRAKEYAYVPSKVHHS